MSKSELRIKKNQMKRTHELRKNISNFTITICLVVILSFTANGFLSNATATVPVEFKYYKSIIVQQEDTLWSIASEYKNDNYESTQSCINEIMQMNGLKEDKITAGSYLIIPYFSDEFIQ